MYMLVVHLKQVLNYSSINIFGNCSY